MANLIALAVTGAIFCACTVVYAEDYEPDPDSITDPDLAKDPDTSYKPVIDLAGQWTDGRFKIIIKGDDRSVKTEYLPGKAPECDLHNGTKVPYDQDFHGDISEDGTRLTGEVAYCRWNTRDPSDAGLKHAPVKMKISADGSRMEACYKTPYSKAGNRFTVTADYTKVEIRHRVFLPPEMIALYVPTVDGVDVLWQLFSGDHRTIQYENGTDRVFQSVVISADPTRSSPLVGKKRAWFGVTRQYDASKGSHVPGKPAWWFQANPGQIHSWSHRERATRTESNNRIDVIGHFAPDSSGADAAEAKLTVNAGIPAAGLVRTIALNINADIVVMIKQKAGDPARYAVFGRHDRFPAFSLYLNQQLVESFHPEAAGTGPFSLSPTESMEVDTGYKNDPSTWPVVATMPISTEAQTAWAADICAEVKDVEQIKESTGHGFLSP